MCVCWFVCICCCLNAYLCVSLLSHNVGYWTTELSPATKRGKFVEFVKLTRPQSSFIWILLSIKHCLADLWPLVSIIGPPAAMSTGHSLSVSSSTTHTYTKTSTCVCDSVMNPWRISAYVLFFIVLHGRSELLLQSLPQNILKKNHHNLTFLLVFQMQKDCFSLPAFKATMTIFLYSNGAKKYVYISLYIIISMQVWLGCSNSPCCCNVE